VFPDGHNGDLRCPSILCRFTNRALHQRDWFDCFARVVDALDELGDVCNRGPTGIRGGHELKSHGARRTGRSDYANATAGQ
jgi:hypothetical protein